jgi:hypothetical protein
VVIIYNYIYIYIYIFYYTLLGLHYFVASILEVPGEVVLITIIERLRKKLLKVLFGTALGSEVERAHDALVLNLN